MKLTTSCVGLCAVAAALLVAVPATAAPMPLYTFTTGYNRDVNSFNIGNEFQTTQKLYVSGIGALIAPGQVTDGLTTVAYTSTLYTADRSTVLASATIPVGTMVDTQNFAYTPLTYELNANTNYVLTSYAGPGASLYSYGSPGSPTGTWNLGSVFVQNWFNVSGAGAPTSTNGGYLEFLGGNLLVDNVAPPQPLPAPEPTTAVMLGVGLVALAKKVRNRQRRQG